MQAIADHRVPPDVRTFLSAHRMLAFVKPDPDGVAPPSIAFGIRPIGIPSAFRRTAHRPLATEATARWSERLLEMGQVGCGLRAGPEVPPRMLQAMLEFDPSCAIDSEDVKNAFNEVDREAVADVLQREDPELYDYFMAYYQTGCLQLFRLFSGELLRLWSSVRGLIQGDALAAVIFDIVYTILVLKPVRESSTENLSSCSLSMTTPTRLGAQLCCLRCPRC